MKFTHLLFAFRVITIVAVLVLLFPTALLAAPAGQNTPDPGGTDILFALKVISIFVIPKLVSYLKAKFKLPSGKASLAAVGILSVVVSAITLAAQGKLALLGTDPFAVAQQLLTLAGLVLAGAVGVYEFLLKQDPPPGPNVTQEYLPIIKYPPGTP